MDEEQRPLLVDGISSEQNHQRGTRHKVQECLEGKSFHWIVIILVCGHFMTCPASELGS